MRLCSGEQAPLGHALQEHLADGNTSSCRSWVNKRTRASSPGAWRLTLPASAGGASKAGAHPTKRHSSRLCRPRHPVLVCLNKLEFTSETLTEWVKKALRASARVVFDELACFKAVDHGRTRHERMVTGGGPVGVKLEQFRAASTLLNNLKTPFQRRRTFVWLCQVWPALSCRGPISL